MSDFKETAVLLIPKEHLAFMKDDKGFSEYIVKRLSSELTNRIMGILEREEEIILRRSDLRVSECMPLNSVEYKRQINWIPLVRCKNCKYFELDHFDNVNGIPLITAHEICTRWSGGCKTDSNGFCFMGERNE